MSWTLYEGDCFDHLPLIESGSVDMVLCDLPYGSTACKWDTPLPLKELWEQYERVIKPNGAIVLTGSQPFTSHLVMSNPKLFKYEWIWDKKKPSSALHCKYQPLRKHEHILIFGKNTHPYNPIMEEATLRIDAPRVAKNGDVFGGNKVYRQHTNHGLKYPKSIIQISNANQRGKVHPTQKPVKLFEYLIRTYTNPGDTVLDNCAGSGTTGVACENLGRNSILMEKEPEYCQIIKSRLQEVTTQTRLPAPAK